MILILSLLDNQCKSHALHWNLSDIRNKEYIRNFSEIKICKCFFTDHFKTILALEKVTNKEIMKERKWREEYPSENSYHPFH